MNFFTGKTKTNVFFLSILFFILVFLVVNTIQVPLLWADTSSCGADSCTCTCVGGYCDCLAGPGDQCQCMCVFPPDYNFCYAGKNPEEPI